MANTLTNLIPDIMTALDTVARERVGLITAVSADPKTERAAIGQTVYSPVAPAATAADNTPGVSAPDTGDQTIGNVSLAITKSKHVPVRWNGEETLGLRNAGNFQNIQQDRFAQAFRTLANLIEVDLAALHVDASRATGTAGTTPFATANNLTDFSGAARILDDNGAPDGERQFVLGSAAMANLRGKQSGLFNVDSAGSADLLRTGFTDIVQGFALRNSGQIVTSTAGTGASATTDNAGYAVGATVLTLASAGTGTIVAGDVVTFAGDTNQYVVVSGDTDVSDGGTITIAAPGLRVAMSAATKAITVVAAAARNMAFHRSAIQLATRKPAMPDGGDSAEDVVEVMDPISGLVYEVAQYKQFLQNVFHVRIAWGVKTVKPEFLSLVLG